MPKKTPKDSARPLVSVIVPVRNEERFLPDCLSSIKKQTFKNFELIVIDNGSTDRSASIAKRLGAKVIVEPRIGKDIARQTGFAAATGDILVRTDADTRVPADWLTRIVAYFNQHSHAVAVTGPAKFFDASPLLNALSWHLCTGIFIINYPLFGHHSLNGYNMAVRKEVWARVKPCRNDATFHEDSDLSFHMAPFGKIAFVPDLIVASSGRRFNHNTRHNAYDYVMRQLRTIWHHRIGKKRMRGSIRYQTAFADDAVTS